MRGAGWRPATSITAAINSRTICRARSSRKSPGWPNASKVCWRPAGAPSRSSPTTAGCSAPMACPAPSCQNTSPPASGPAAPPSRANPGCLCPPPPGAGTPSSSSPPPTAPPASTPGGATPLPTAASACRSASPQCWLSPTVRAASRRPPSPRSAGKACAATLRSAALPLACRLISAAMPPAAPRWPPLPNRSTLAAPAYWWRMTSLKE